MKMGFTLTLERGAGQNELYLEVACARHRVHPRRPLLRSPRQAHAPAPPCEPCSTWAPRTSPSSATATRCASRSTELAVGDRFVVRPGEKVATDGVVEEGSSAIDASLLTGESVPVEVGPGDAVTGATVNAGGRLVVRATRVGADTALAQIARLVTDAQNGKAPVQRLADQISAVFVPDRHRARRRHPRVLARHRRDRRHRVHRRRRRADHRLPVRPRARHADRAPRRHRPRRPARHPHQRTRGPRVHPPGRHHRARQDRHRHHRPHGAHRRRHRRRHRPRRGAAPRRRPRGRLRAPHRQGHRHRRPRAHRRRCPPSTGFANLEGLGVARRRRRPRRHRRPRTAPRRLGDAAHPATRRRQGRAPKRSGTPPVFVGWDGAIRAAHRRRRHRQADQPRGDQPRCGASD